MENLNNNKPDHKEKEHIEKHDHSEKEQKEIKQHETKKIEKKEIKKKEFAIVIGKNLSVSYKISGAVCRMIRKKGIDRAIGMVEEVLKYKRAVPMNNMEIPHRKGKGMMSGRYPQNVCKEFVMLLKQLKANSSVNGLNNPAIFLAKADKASCPFRREGRRAKRANIYLEARERTELNKKQNKNEK